VPRGLARLGGHWNGLLPGYGAHSGGGAAVVSYLASAVLGVAVLVGVVWLLVKLRRRGARPLIAPPPKDGAL